MTDPQPPDPMHDLLDLYRLAVQHPLAEVAFVERCWEHYHGRSREPVLLREDFAGTCAVAAAWCASDPDRQAMAIEIDQATAEWAAQRFDHPDLHIVPGNVMAVDGPAVDVALALNFSVLTYHDRASLQAYLAHAGRALHPGGLLILDLFGGPGAEQPCIQKRRIEPDEAGFTAFNYAWEQRAFDPNTRRIDCRIHFELGGDNRMTDAFVYNWRLWHAVELIELASGAGFESAQLWWSDPDMLGRFVPIPGEPDARAWVAYLVCRKPGDAGGSLEMF